MTLHSSLLQSVATLDRIAPEQTEHTSKLTILPRFSDDETFALHDDQDGTISIDHPYAWRDDEKFIRLSTSTAASLPYTRDLYLHRRYHDSRFLPEPALDTMESAANSQEPKLSLRYVASVSLDVAFTFLAAAIPSIGITIVGLAADTIAFSQSSTTTVVKAIVTSSTDYR